MSGIVQKLVDRPAEAVLFRGPGRTITAADFLADAGWLASQLPRHAHVANLCQDRYGFALGLAAALLRGQVSLLSGDLSTALLQRLSAEYPDCYALADATDGSDAVSETVAAGGLKLFRLPRFRAGRAIGTPAPLPVRQPAIVVLTSGSTGQPTATRKDWGELVARSRAAAKVFSFNEDAPSAVVGTVPPGHMYGLETTILLPLHAAVSSWCGPAFYPADIAAVLDCLPGPRVLVTTPLHLRALLQSPAPARPPGRVISATAPLDRETAAQAERLWGTQVLEIFGASEVGSIASRQTTAEQDWTLYPGLMLRNGTGNRLYLHAPQAEPRPLADRLEVASDGRGFTLLGRAADVVKLGGRRASLLGLTRVLLAVPGVQDGAFLAPDDLDRDPGGRLAAFVVAPDQDEQSLLRALRAEIDPVFLPRPLVLVEALPRDALGKLPREALLAMLAARTQDSA